VLPFLVRSDLWSHTCAISNMPRCSCGSALATANKRHSAARLRWSAVFMTTPIDHLSNDDGCNEVPGWAGRRPQGVQVRASSRGTSVRGWGSLRTKRRDPTPSNALCAVAQLQRPQFPPAGVLLVRPRRQNCVSRRPRPFSTRSCFVRRALFIRTTVGWAKARHHFSCGSIAPCPRVS
jgi:hypothetical protein